MTTASTPIAHQFGDARQQHASAALGMWLFLLTEVMLFGVLFTVYAVYRYLHPASFAAGSGHLDLWLGTANTAILIGSSLTMVLAHHAIAHDAGARGKIMLFLGLTVLLGFTFLGIKGVEYRAKFRDHVVPGTHFQWTGKSHANAGEKQDAAVAKAPDVAAIELFYSLYFVMTGLHAAHMVIGLGLLLVLMALAWRRRLRATVVEMSGLYWHFVDVVWIFLFPLLYLLGRHA